jgi:hypothetical protein
MPEEPLETAGNDSLPKRRYRSRPPARWIRRYGSEDRRVWKDVRKLREHPLSAARLDEPVVRKRYTHRARPSSPSDIAHQERSMAAISAQYMYLRDLRACSDPLSSGR